MAVDRWMWLDGCGLMDVARWVDGRIKRIRWIGWIGFIGWVGWIVGSVGSDIWMDRTDQMDLADASNPSA